MPVENPRLRLPEYNDFVSNIALLNLEQSASQLHGLMCGYLCAGNDSQGEAYISHLLLNKKDLVSRDAVLAIARIYSISQQQMTASDFEFELLLPDDDSSLMERAKAFSEWCQGFTQSLKLAGVDEAYFYDDEAQEALQHLNEFAELDYLHLDIDEEDELALMEVYEYTRMAIFRLHSEVMLDKRAESDDDIKH